MMNFGLTLATHGIATRDGEGDAILHRLDVDQMQPVEDAVRAEELGFHSIWLSDHIVTERVSRGEHTANTSGKRAYPDRPNLLDVPTTMAAIASRTTTLRFSPSVYIAPYRHPLITAHQLATIDVLSKGRAMLTVGVGWELGEFDALGASFEHRGSVTDEVIQICKQAWTQDWVNFSGRHYTIHDISMDPKPIQKPHLPIWYGGITPIAAKRAARRCDALYPMFLDAHGHPEKFDHLRVGVAQEAERIHRDISGFRLAAFCVIRLCGEREVQARFGGTRPLLTGTASQVLEDIQVFADFGYDHITAHFDAPSGTTAEWGEQIEQFAAEVMPESSTIHVARKF